jgi:2-polyprenyl-6-methoxyphenol hydroxylase-like FAD-dependent oxidoreductase
MTDSYDLVVVGSGIGGGALACVMRAAGKSVLLLEESTEYRDKVRGEWIAPWGVVETRRVGLYDLLMASGGHHLSRHLTYDETREPADAEATGLPLDAILPEIPGPLCIGHPHHCQVLFDEAARRGAEAHRGVRVDEVVLGAEPSVTFTMDGRTRTARARLVIGADGRQSIVRKTAGIALHQDPPHHMFGGLLVEGVDGWDEHTQAIGTENDFAFLTFPQGNGKARVYGSYSLSQRGRFAGPNGAQAFLDAFRMACSPKNNAIANARPAGPLMSYFNSSAAAETPIAEGAVLIGDAAGWNDPIVGQGLSITYRDVRLVTDLLKSTDDWRPELFAPYAEERAERMRRLRIAAMISATLDAEFGPEARDRRRRHFARALEDPMSYTAHAIAVMAGPENVPAEVFSEEHIARVIGEAARSA